MIGLFRNKLFLLFLALVNFAVGAFSFSYYLPQLSQSNLLVWIFIADCPIYAVLFGINLLLLVLDRPNSFLSFITIVGNFKYGLWTIFVMFLSGAAFSYPVFILSHVLFIMETLVLFDLFVFRVKHVLFATVWFVFNDFLDYALGLHPWIEGNLVSLAGLFSVSSSIILPFLLSVLYSKRENRTNSAPRELNRPKTKKRWGHTGN